MIIIFWFLDPDGVFSGAGLEIRQCKASFAKVSDNWTVECNVDIGWPGVECRRGEPVCSVLLEESSPRKGDDAASRGRVLALGRCGHVRYLFDATHFRGLGWRKGDVGVEMRGGIWVAKGLNGWSDERLGGRCSGGGISGQSLTA